MASATANLDQVLDISIVKYFWVFLKNNSPLAQTERAFKMITNAPWANLTFSMPKTSQKLSPPDTTCPLLKLAFCMQCQFSVFAYTETPKIIPVSQVKELA